MKAARMAVNALLAIVIAALLVVAVPRVFGVQYLSVLSGSMAPAVPVGSMAVSVPVDPSQIHVGDIVSYVADTQRNIVTHRVVEIDSANETIMTRGDASVGNSIPVLEANVVGIVRFVVPYIGYPLSFLSSLTGKILALTGIAALFILATLVNRIETRKDPRRQLVINFNEVSELTDEAFAEARGKIEQGIMQSPRQR